MLTKLQPNTSFSKFLQTLDDLQTDYILLFLTFKGCYSSLLSKDRRMSSSFTEGIPLVEVDVHASPEIYTQLSETMPTVVLARKLPVHLFCQLKRDTATKKLGIIPLLRNFTTLGDTHFKHIQQITAKQE